MNTEERIKKQKQLIETMGQHYEKEGMQPVAGRTLALLMVMDKEEFTFDEIVEELQISKSSASVALKLLQVKNIVEYKTHPGDRKRYFRIKRQEPFLLIDDFKQKLTRDKQILEEIIELKADPNSENSQFMKNLISIMEFFLDHFEKLKEEFLKKD
ncbi:MAG: MarR family transcriptional regulator [Bacteroidales bacterium]|nr:MarR family transcriptional regulator [Bacteroidales bacterium]MCF8327985.1 MarR family transcriptional regulator [Bacteroidales bacterium]